MGKGSKRSSDDSEGRSKSKSSKSSPKSSPTPPPAPALTPQQQKRWRAHVAADSYIEVCSNIMFPNIQLNPYGFTNGSYPLERPTLLGVLTSSLRRRTVIENWSPLEVSRFEASLSVYGKQFHVASKVIRTKTTREVIEFYYVWKKTGNYRAWKKGYETIIGDDGYALAGVEFQGTGERMDSKGGGEEGTEGLVGDEEEEDDDDDKEEEDDGEGVGGKEGKKSGDVMDREDFMDDEEY
ncbi:hypothetical protein TrRE_jg13328 [Triparma retinervis]|uniref:SANT domain-containing protein n=1 Tax=Triparma retinervis TaxID=2557542 RepID=A0A9W7AF28_9STRA|nr:hypothetical protein TrRE_jg13328 [Triparma retinervis]